MFGVLFVCTGNICRSPTAEAVFRHCVEESGLEQHFRIDSAGTHGYHIGEPPDSRAVQAARKRGVPMNGLIARKVSAADFEVFDLILAMDEGHYAILERLSPVGGGAEILMFMEHAAQNPGACVPDPYYGSPADFDHALNLVEQGAQGLLDHLRQRLGL